MVTINRITDYLRMLSETIGVRPIGSLANQRAAIYIEDFFAKLGLIITKQTFPCPDWVGKSACITIGNQTMTALPNTFSPSCNVSGTISAASSIEELEQIFWAR